MEITTHTPAWNRLMNALALRRPLAILPHSTLNEKLNILPDVTLQPSVYPSVMGFVVGLRGAESAIGPQGAMGSKPLLRKLRYASPYWLIPMVLREMTNDLTAAERQQYALRRTEEHGGRMYYAYYVKRFDLTGVTVETNIMTKKDGVVSVDPFIPVGDDLNPTPPDVSQTGTNVVTSEYLQTQSPVPMILSAKDITELMNVANLLTGSDIFSIITEAALVTGVDQVIQVGADGQTGAFNFNELVCCQCAMHVAVNWPLQYANQKVGETLNLGITEPMLDLRNINSGS